jgi:hypothetical protein
MECLKEKLRRPLRDIGKLCIFMADLLSVVVPGIGI